MIPVAAAPEPASFDIKVRQPGLRFLARQSGAPDWRRGSYWRLALPDLREAYLEICCYSAEWIPSTTGTSSVDHFEPLSARRDLAYEWSNFRHAAARLNARKRNVQGILDPFTIGANWFALDFPSLLIRPGAALPDSRRGEFGVTVAVLLLNGETSISSRMRWVRGYCDGLFTFAYLKESAPFIASEIERQGLVSTLAQIMMF